MANSSCASHGAQQKFIIIDKLHVLGANIDSNKVFKTINSENLEKEAIKHNLFSNIVIHVVDDPSTSVYNNEDSYEKNQTGCNNLWQAGNATFISETSYTNQLKSVLYNESVFVEKSTQPTVPNGFYQIPTDNILNFGVIYNKISGKYEYCLIDEANEKSYYTLETKLFTHPDVYTGMSGHTIERNIWSQSHAGVTLQHDSDKRGYFHKLISGNPVYGDGTTAIPNGKRTSNLYIDIPGDVGGQWYYYGRYVEPTLGNLNPIDANSFYTGRYNFFMGPMDDDTDYYAWTFENMTYSILSFPGGCEGLPTGVTENNCMYGIHNKGHYSRYFAAGTHIHVYTQSELIEPSYRFIGNLLSSANAYTSELSLHDCCVDNMGKVERQMEYHSDVNVDSNGYPTTFNTPLPWAAWGDNSVPYALTKQTNAYSQKYDSSVAGNNKLVKRVPFKSGVSNKMFIDSSTLSTMLNTQAGALNYLNTTGNEGYLYDRDVILVNKGGAQERDYTISSKSYSNNTWGGAYPREMEFELFYCTNINNVWASQTLFNFARKLNNLTSGFNTGILKENVPNKKKYQYFAPTDPNYNENDFVHIQQLKNYNDSSLVYGCTFECPNTTESGNVDIMKAFLEGNYSEQLKTLSTIPTVEIKNVYIWEDNKPVTFGSKKLVGQKVNGKYTYGQYYLAYFAHNIYLIQKAVFDKYMYTADEFINLVDDFIDPNDTGYTTGMTDPFTYSNAALPTSECRNILNSYAKLGLITAKN